MSSNPGPGYQQHPAHRVDLEPGPARVRVIFNGEIIADTRSALTVRETNYSPVHYIPSQDVRKEALRPSRHQSYCPFKGQASYWSIEAGGKEAADAVWAYQNPYDEVASLKDYMAFYPNRVDEILID